MMKFVGGSETGQNITAMALSPNNRFQKKKKFSKKYKLRYPKNFLERLHVFLRYLAVAETTNENKAIVTIYDLMHDGAKKRKVLSNTELQVKMDLNFQIKDIFRRPNLFLSHFRPIQNIWLLKPRRPTGCYCFGFGRKTSF